MLIIRYKKSGDLFKPLGLAEDPLYNNFNYKAIFHYSGMQWTNGVIWFSVESGNVKTAATINLNSSLKKGLSVSFSLSSTLYPSATIPDLISSNLIFSGR